MRYIGHAEGGREQSLAEHLHQTASLAELFASAFGAADMGRRCGMLHDIGKYSDMFQRRIRGSGEQADHATAGALEARALGDIPCAFCVAGHHKGLPDMGKKIDGTESSSFNGKMKRRPGAGIEEYGRFREEIEVPAAKAPPELIRDQENAFFFIRMLYSCLVDADYLDTEAFVSDGAVRRGGYEKLEELQERLKHWISPWLEAKEKSELNQKRCQILGALTKWGEEARGLFTLTVPTGGGKTVSSMAFALRHALKHGLRRVIYVIPYTSIIEQTQEVFGKIFGAENVVAHYANVTYNTEESKKETDRRALAAENWDAPIILTTSVQFFESLYANRPSRCRKLHNIADSVLVFDEAQMLPVPYLIPCLAAVAQLVQNYGCTAVLCTATQPSLDGWLKKLLPDYPPRELCPDWEGMYDFFRRVRYVREGKLADGELAGRLAGERQVLCIVNSRRQAQAIYALLGGEGAFHLSTAMTPRDRRTALEEIRQRLKDGEPCRVVSTSLVEAGVDVDFPAVWRSVAGLDSILQAGGRCNREGNRPARESAVHIFETEERTPETLRQNIAAAEHVMREVEDISAPEAVKEYFDFLFYLKGDEALDRKNLMREIRAGEFPFASVAERFHIIENAEYTVYIPQGEGAERIERLRAYGPSRGLMRDLGQYAVGVYPKHFKDLLALGAAEPIEDVEDAAVLLDESLYSEKTGLALIAEEGKGIFITT